MDKISCYIVKDLMPLYVDEVVSEETAQAIRTHLDQCESCRGEYQTLNKKLSLPSSPDIQKENSRALKRFKWKLVYQKLAISCFSVLLTLALLGGVFIFGKEVITETIAGHTALSPTVFVTRRQASGEWERVMFEDGDYLVLDWPFCTKEVVNHTDNPGDITLRFRDADGGTVLDEVTLSPGKATVLAGLELRTEYIVEMKAQPGEYILVFK